MSLKGSSLVLKKGTSSGGTVIAAARSFSYSWNGGDLVDVTSADDVNRWRQLLAGAGTKSLTLSFSGVLKDEPSHNQLHLDCNAQTNDAYGVVIGTLGTFDGNFRIANIEGSGEFNAEAQVQVTLESAGDITYAAVV